jgi:glycosyltransferase involved in cell wall biosynthesis
MFYSQIGYLKEKLGLILKTTFLVVTYNQVKFISQCLDSIENQSKAIDELVIADDFSMDGTQEIIENFIAESKISCIKFIKRNANIGIVANLNDAMAQASGDIIIISAGDDYSSIDRVKKTANLFLDGGINTAYSSYAFIDEEGQIGKSVLRMGVESNPIALIKKGSAYPNQGMAFRASFYRSIAPMDEKLANEDDYLGMASVLNGGINFMPEVLYFYRIHARSISGWSLLSEKSAYIQKYFTDQKNRTANYKAWEALINKSSAKNKNDLIILIKMRIKLSSIYENLIFKSLICRLKALKENYKACGMIDFILIVFGYRGIFIIKKLRQIKMKI